MEDSKVEIILEGIRHDFKAFGEGLSLTNQKIDGIDDRLNTIEHDLKDIKFTLNVHAAKIARVK